MERKLAAILAADVVGYSALMERDETGTFERLRANHKELLEPTVEKHRGRIFKLMGDGVLAEFGSVVDAVECAVELQIGLLERSAGLPADQRILARIGINLGEVIVEGEDRYGEGVNVAARLQTLAEIGGICVSGKVAREAEKKLNVVFEPMGEQRVKNIAEPIPVYKVRIGGLQLGKMPPKAQSSKSAHINRLRKAAVVAAALLAVAGGAVAGGASWWRSTSVSITGSGPPTIAVLPLANMSGDPGLQYFADGTTENLIALLARSPQIKVVARTSTDAYKGKSIDIRQIGKELGVRYILEGSVQKSAGKLRIVAQLIDARNGEHVWAEHFDRESADPLALEDEVSDSIVKTLAGDEGLIKKKQYEDEWGKDTARLDEWDYYLRGHELFMRFSKEDMDKAAQIWGEGLRKYPDSTLLKAKLGWANYQRWFHGWTADPQHESQSALRYAQEVLEANGPPPLAVALAHWLRGALYGDVQGDYERAVSEYRIAIKLMPSELMPKTDIAFYLVGAGKPDEAIATLDWLSHESKDNPALSGGFCNLAMAHFVKKEYVKAVEDLQGIVDLNANCLAILASSYFMTGQIDKAKLSVKNIRDTDSTTRSTFFAAAITSLTRRRWIV